MFHETTIKPIFDVLIGYLTSQEVQGFIFPVKIAFLAISSFFLGFIIFALIRTSWLRSAYLEEVVEFITYKPFGLKKLTKNWRKIVARLELASEAEYKLAVIEADNMLDSLLRKLKYPGQTTEEILRKIPPAVLSSPEKVLEAHKIRNNIVHDPDYRLSLDQARETLQIYEQALRDLEAI